MNSFQFPKPQIFWTNNYILSEWNIGLWFKLDGVNGSQILPWTLNDNSKWSLNEINRNQILLEFQMPD